MVPFRQFVLKVHSRCDLACDHCYVYEHSDQSWRGRPKDGMSSEAARYAAERIAEHAAAHRLPEVHVILHGGEPLLLGVRRTREVLEVLRSLISPVTKLVLRMHTNGVLLSEEYLDLLTEYDVHVGVSLDGGREANDLHRVDRRGQSSYNHVVAALDLLRRPAYRHLYSGLLCTIDLQNDAVDAYTSLVAQEPPRIDFLLPHATWEHQPFGLPARREPATATQGAAPYAQWLGAVFDVWDKAGRPVPIRTFDSVLAALHGRPSGTESLGLVPADLLVIETDGTLEQADWLKTAFEGAAATGFDVFRNTLDEAATHAGIMARQHGLDDLCGTCRACPVVGVCGGGLYAHRYDPATGFDNPSVYCPDLVGMIHQISRAEGVKVPDPVTNTGAEARSGAETGIEVLDADTKTHMLGRADFDTLAAGYGSETAVHTLADAQYSIRRNLLAALASAGPQDNRLFTAAWDRLATLDEERAEAVDRALSHPHGRVWAARCLEDPTAGGDTGDAVHLAAIAASAHLAADSATSLMLPVRQGLVHLPGFGALRVPEGSSEVVVETLPAHRIAVTIDTQPREIDVIEQSADPTWLPLWHLKAEGLTVTLEDLDPYRDCHYNPAPRLSADTVARWQAVFPEAIDFIDEQLPLHAPALRAGLSAVVPLALDADGSHRGTADRHAFGAIGATLPDDPALLALLLVRGFQQVKLSALLDLYALYDATDTEPRHYAPWRAEPLPLADLFLGTYTYVAVTEFWRVRRHTLLGEAAAVAETNFTRWRGHTSEAVAGLLDSASLTALGEQVVRALAETLAPWLDEPVSPGAAIAAQRSAAEHRAGFDERRKALR